MSSCDVPGPGRPCAPDPDFPSQYTDFILEERFDTSEAEKATRDAYNKKYGLNE